MTDVASIDLDVHVAYYNGETIEQVVGKLTADTNVTGKVKTEHGPAGGNPVITLTGERMELAEVIKRYDAPDRESMRDDILAHLDMALLDILIPVDGAFAADDPEYRVIRDNEVLLAVEKWAQGVLDEPRTIAMQILMQNGVSEEEATHAYYG